MDKLDQYRVFLQVADLGNFTKAANTLGLPRASVSAAIQQLESAVSTRLLHRTTRHVQLTADGTQLAERVRPLIADAEEIDQLFQTRRRQVTGRLVVDVPSRIARRLIAPAIPGFLRRYPQLQLVLRSTDRAIDLVREGVDGVVRVGSLNDSSLVARPIGRLSLINCASPAYLRDHGTPAHPAELTDGHWAVGYAASATDKEVQWGYLRDGHEQEIPLPCRVIVNNAESYIACCRAGLGLIQIPRYDVQYLLNTGELVEIMPNARAAAMEISLLYPHRRQRSRRLAVFMEWFEALIGPHLEAY